MPCLETKGICLPLCCAWAYRPSLTRSYSSLLYALFSGHQPPLVGTITLVTVDYAVQALPQLSHVERLDEPHVRDPGFRAGKVLVLLEHRGQAPTLQFPEATHQTTCPMLHKDERKDTLAEDNARQ